MENLVQLQNGSKSYGSKVLFDQASFAINEGEHVGVIGPNGAGKTTLFKSLIGEELLDSGQIITSRRLRLGYLSQHDHWKENETIEDFISRDAILPIWELKTLGIGLGLTEEHYSRPVQSFSGGYRMRAKLLRMLGQQPNLMLLDEPTNYLDLETLMVLEKFLQGFDGSFLLISHDREFLRRTTDHVLEVEAGAITKFNGNIDDYFEQKEMLRSQLEAQALSVEQKRNQVLDFVARFGAKATKARQAQSRLKSLDRLESIEIKPLPMAARFRIPAPARTGKRVLQVQGAELGYPERTVLRDLNLELMSGEHLAVVGLNGAGKSTLMKTLAGRLQPLRGALEYGYECTIGFFAQHVAEELNPDHTVLRALQQKAHADVLPQEILDLAGTLLFAGDDVQKPIRVLSGGEKSRVALGQVLLQKASCLFLDEPTNHLDFHSVEALTQALQSFAGAVVVVSHDRAFIRRIGTKILEVHQGHARTFPGTYDEYVWSIERGAYSTLTAERSASSSAKALGSQAGAAESTAASPRSNYKEEKKALDRRLKQAENKIRDMEVLMAKNQQRIEAINHELSTSTSASKDLIQEMGMLQAQIDEAEVTWLQSAEEREKVQSEIAVLQAGVV